MTNIPKKILYGEILEYFTEEELIEHNKMLEFLEQKRLEEKNNPPLTIGEKVVQLENALLETTTLLANEQAKNLQNEQAIIELSMLIGGVN